MHVPTINHSILNAKSPNCRRPDHYTTQHTSLWLPMDAVKCRSSERTCWISDTHHNKAVGTGLIRWCATDSCC